MLKIYKIRLSVILTINKYSLLLQVVLESQILRNVKVKTRITIAFLKINLFYNCSRFRHVLQL